MRRGGVGGVVFGGGGPLGGWLGGSHHRGMGGGVIGRLVFGGGRRWPWAVVAFAGLLGMAGAVAPWEGPAWPWRSPGIYAVHRGTTSYPHDARQCFALAAIVVVVGVAGWFGVRGLVSRLVLL